MKTPKASVGKKKPRKHTADKNPRKFLTAKQEAFCLEYVANGRKGSDAYRKVYDNFSGSDDVLYVRASELLQNSKVLVRISNLMTKIEAPKERKALHSLQDHYEAAYESFLMAKVKELPAAAVAAVIASARLHGHIKEKKEVTIKSFDTLGADDVRNELRAANEKLQMLTDELRGGSVVLPAKKKEEQSPSSFH